jgi:K+-sensing histidine kinase KdpD
LKSYIQKKYYVLEIKDNGRGIAAEQVKNISDSINSSDFIVGANGNGLGLIVTGKLLKAYNGKLEIESQQNSYTKIRLHFDRQKTGG